MPIETLFPDSSECSPVFLTCPKAHPCLKFLDVDVEKVNGREAFLVIQDKVKELAVCPVYL